MADNLRYKEPVAGEGQPVNTEELTIDGVLAHVQRVKIALGSLNTYQRDLQAGQTTMANSLPVTVASDQYINTEHARSTMYGLQGTGSALNSFPIAASDTQNYRWVSVQVTGISNGNEVTFEGTNDDTTWFPLSLLNTKSTWQTIIANQDGIFHGPICIKSFRVRVSAYVSGQVSAVAKFSATPTTMHATYSRTELGLPIDLMDTLPSGQQAGSVIAFNYGFNKDGNLWQRIPVGTATPATSDPAVPIRIIGAMPGGLGRKATYYAAINPIYTTNPTLNSSQSLAYLWHPSTNMKRVSIQKMLISFVSRGGSGDYTIRVARITAENASPGGTPRSICKQDPSDPASTCSFTAFANAPVRDNANGSGDAVIVSIAGNHSGQLDLVDIIEGKGFICRSGVAEGWEARIITESDMGTAPKIAATFIWVEE